MTTEQLTNMAQVWNHLMGVARQTGKTTALKQAARQINAILVTGTHAEAQALMRQGFAAAGMQHPEELHQLMVGCSRPILFDTDAVAVIGLFYSRRLLEMGMERKALVTENRMLREKLDKLEAESIGETK